MFPKTWQLLKLVSGRLLWDHILKTHLMRQPITRMCTKTEMFRINTNNIRIIQFGQGYMYFLIMVLHILMEKEYT